MKFLLTILLLATVSTAFGNDVTKQNVEEMLDQMVKEEVISAGEAEKARIRLHSMNKNQWQRMHKDAHKVAARQPASVDSGNVQDLHSAQFKQIESDIRNIVPDRRD